MLIHCTKKLLDELKVTPTAETEEDSLYSWHANIIKRGRKKTVVLVNDKNRYAIVLYGLKAKEMKQIDQLIVQAIRKTFQEESIKDEVIDQYLQQSSEISFSKTKNRTCVARLNKACENAYFFDDALNMDTIIQEELSIKISSLLVGDGKKSYIHPNEQMYKDLEEMAGQAIFSSEAYELKVTLNLENHSVWRNITVPINTTFNRLHNILQVAFGWQNSHLHDFSIYPIYNDDNVIPMNKDTAVMNLVCDPEASSYQDEVPMKMETRVKLSDILPARIVYSYDFGDDWTHTIEVQRVIEDYRFNYPTCTDGEGDTPPEDVGGEGGYDEFLKIVNDKNHPDHAHMVNWGTMQGYKKFDLKEINWRLGKVERFS
ncbi:plasmid pRiA4b ORF-3 family protein [Guptibacillus hwajinpoensis]|uniref:TnpR protein n=1 Tax=Guptibacillus hwajinpoensis TaxID=208199 RepID=A0ABU0JZG5_9BACL|nr:plasmid pRiA4b ORF-3 family protein [Alkalihalobacillus hemicentroti]MDQ0482507.1 hypothetical protein [Alkalihalobacillus hemicentroti]